MGIRNNERTFTEALGCYVTKEVKDEFENIAKDYKMSKSDLLRQVIDRAIEDWQISNKDDKIDKQEIKCILTELSE